MSNYENAPATKLLAAVFVGGGVEALDRYVEVSREERAELDAAYAAAFALGGHAAVVELVKGRAP